MSPKNYFFQLLITSLIYLGLTTPVICAPQCPSQDIFNTALEEERERTKLIISEIDKLSKILAKIAQDKDPQEFQKRSLELIDKDIEMIKALNEEIKNKNKYKPTATYSLKSNKNYEIFSCAKKILEEDYDILISDSYQKKYPLMSSEKTYIGGSDGNLMGTSIPNCIQTAMLTIFRVIYDSNKFNKIDKLKESELFDPDFMSITPKYTKLLQIKELVEAGIYDVYQSPNIQTTKLPENFDHSLIPGFTEWFYFYKDALSPPQGELLFPTLGYAFGGSRQDSRYNDKKMKTEDCSSSVAKWTNSKTPFSTKNMKEAFENNCGSDNYCLAAKEVLDPIKEGLTEATAGNIFVYRTQRGGHTGFVSDIKNETCFEHLSYNRDVPEIEGLGFRINCIDEPGKQYMFFSYKEDESSCENDEL